MGNLWKKLLQRIKNASSIHSVFESINKLTTYLSNYYIKSITCNNNTFFILIYK